MKNKLIRLYSVMMLFALTLCVNVTHAAPIEETENQIEIVEFTETGEVVVQYFDTYSFQASSAHGGAAQVENIKETVEVSIHERDSILHVIGLDTLDKNSADALISATYELLENRPRKGDPLTSWVGWILAALALGLALGAYGKRLINKESQN